MKSRSWCSRARQSKRFLGITLLTLAVCVGAGTVARASDAPDWMRSQVNAPVPAHDEKTNAVEMYSETLVTVLSEDEVRVRERRVYKILRPEGREYGIVGQAFTPSTKITAMKAWCIPASGKDYEVKEKESVDVAYNKVDGGELISDVKIRLMQIPAADVGNLVGYELELRENPLVLQQWWGIQGAVPVREARFVLHLPAGWQYKATFMNTPEVPPLPQPPDTWEWVVRDVPGVRGEDEMPPYEGVAAHMIVTMIPPGGHSRRTINDWGEMGRWYLDLTSGRREATPAMKHKVAELTAQATTPLDKMKAIAAFMQKEVRYVAISLGIGGVQPHPASEVFDKRFGDCKDKATLMSTMLKEIGVDSYYVIINNERGSVSEKTPAAVGDFNHAVLAIRLPDGLNDPSLVATIHHPRLGRLLFFDPTNQLAPFGRIGGYLQGNYGLLVTPEGGELVMLPILKNAPAIIQRRGNFTLSAAGTLEGEVEEYRSGDFADAQRYRLRSVTKDSDRIKPIESVLSNSISEYHIHSASVMNAEETDRAFGFRYKFVAPAYGKPLGELVAVRPRVLGTKANSLLEKKEARHFPIVFDGPERHTDDFTITIPPGYEVDDLPAPVDVEYSFASYHARTKVEGNQLHYTRTYEVKELLVPVERSNELKKFYRMVFTDERNTAVLKPAAKASSAATEKSASAK